MPEFLELMKNVAALYKIAKPEEKRWIVENWFSNRTVAGNDPCIPELQYIIDNTETGDLTFLISEHGRRYTANSIGNRFKKWCLKAGIPDRSLHGLRKAAAARLAEEGCTEQEIMAITGHRTSKEVTRYTQSASQRKRAESALTRMSSRSSKER